MEWIIEAIQTKKKTPQNEFNENTKTKINFKQKTSLYCCFLLFLSFFFWLILGGKQLLPNEIDYMIIFSISKIV